MVPGVPAEGENTMSTIRTALLSVVLTLVIAVAAFFTAVPMSARASQTATSGCPSVSVSSLSTEQLWNLLNARYVYRVGMPR